MTDPLDDLAVIWRRNACGAVESLAITQGDALLLDTSDDGTLSYLLRAAREYYKNDPHAGHLPPDYAIVAAWEEYLA